MKTILTTIFAIALMVFAFNTNSAEAAGAWGVFGSNEKVDPNETQTARPYEPDYQWKWEIDPRTGNWGWHKKYKNEDGTSGYKVVCSGRDAIYGCWNQENDDRELASTRPLTKREKQIQDENDWNEWILRQFSGLRPGQQEALEQGESWQSWTKQQFASYWKACQRSGNCMMLDEDNESEIANLHRRGRDAELRELCAELGLPYPCVSIWWNEDAESKDGFGGRDIADSGNEGSTSAAGASDQ